MRRFLFVFLFVSVSLPWPATAGEIEHNDPCLTALEEAAKIVTHEDLPREQILDVDSLKHIDDLRCHEEEKMVNTAIVVRLGDQTAKFAVFHLHLTKEGAPHPLMPPREWKPFTKEDLRIEWCGLMAWREESLKEQGCK